MLVQVLAMVQCLSVSVTSQSSIELTGEITLVFEDSSELSCSIRKFTYLHKYYGGSVAEWLACWTQAQKGPGSNCIRHAVW